MYKFIGRNGKDKTIYKDKPIKKLSWYEQQQLQNFEKEPITYDECLDITGDDPGDKIQEKTGKHPTNMFIETLKQHGYTYNEIYREIPYPIERIRKIQTNSKYKKEAPPGINFTYELQYVQPIKYKLILQKMGVNVDNIPYWKNIN